MTSLRDNPITTNLFFFVLITVANIYTSIYFTAPTFQFFLIEVPVFIFVHLHNLAINQARQHRAQEGFARYMDEYDWEETRNARSLAFDSGKPQGNAAQTDDTHPKRKVKIDFPRTRLKSGSSPLPDNTPVYPFLCGTPGPHIPDEAAVKHGAVLCRATLNYVENRDFQERDLRIGELVIIVLSKTGWWFAMSDESQGGNGWVPSIFLERYDPAQDPGIYYDKTLPTQSRPLYLYNPSARPKLDKEDVDAMLEMLEPVCDVMRVGSHSGVYEIGVATMEGLDKEKLPELWKGWPITYKKAVEWTCAHIDAGSREQRTQKWFLDRG